MLVRVRIAARSAEGRGATPEQLANEHDFYLDGWVDAVLALSAERLPELSRSIERDSFGGCS